MLSDLDFVALLPYSAGYPQRFAAETRHLQEILASVGPGFQHVGSTAVPGLAAKPVVDIAASVTRFPLAGEMIAHLEQAGYVYWADNPATDFQLFIKGVPRTHHLHVYPLGSPRLADKCRFRDYLRAHPLVASAYEELKRRLTQQFRTDREGYTAGKTEFVREVLRQASS